MTLLLLAGTNEAKRIVNVLAERGVDVVASLAGATRQPTALPVPTRIGGFGGEVGFRAYLETHNITAVLDATHPFAHRITDRTARICRGMSLPYAAVVRPEWAVQNSEKWTSISEPQEAACHISVSAIVFLATGRQTLAQFANLGGRRVLARVIDPPMAPFPFVGGEFVVGRPLYAKSGRDAVHIPRGHAFSSEKCRW